MDEVIEKNDQDQEHAQNRRVQSLPGQAGQSQTKTGKAPDKNRALGNSSAGNRTLRAMLPVKIDIESVIQKHSGGVERTGPNAEENQRQDRPAPSKQPAGQTIGPDGGEIGAAGQN